MKRLALTVAAAALAWLGTTTEGSAHSSCGSSSSTYISTYSRCGCPVYVQRYIAYYDHCNRPVWRTRVLPVNHRCRSSYRPQHCDNGSGYGYSYNGYSGQSSAQYYGSRGGSNVVIRARW
ncbi:MAG: hypothetical protein CFE26_05725 [Verrucomicrobiales bacterium VVV1]|nr:MAG: hypothetical protein CFE26_05725 [Verrucomicrobiales bacterium VVV1]